MFQKDIKKQEIVEVPVGDDTCWGEVTGFHLPDAIQLKILTKPEHSDKKVGDYIKVASEDVIRRLERGPVCDDD